MGRANRKVPRSEGRNGLTAHVTEFVRLFKSMVDPYRPELHYMRGPGPRWHAKHAPHSAAEAPQMSGLAHSKG